MKRVTISGLAQAFSEPRSRTPIADPDILMQLEGAWTGETCAEHLSEELRRLDIHGGSLQLTYDEADGLRVMTSYRVYREPTPAQLTQLVQETESQWSDGVGAGSFNSSAGELLSTTLAMALENSGESEGLGSVFINVYPDVDDRQVRHDMHDATSPGVILGAALGVIVLLSAVIIWMVW